MSHSNLHFISIFQDKWRNEISGTPLRRQQTRQALHTNDIIVLMGLLPDTTTENSSISEHDCDNAWTKFLECRWELREQYSEHLKHQLQTWCTEEIGRGMEAEVEMKGIWAGMSSSTGGWDEDITEDMARTEFERWREGKLRHGSRVRAVRSRSQGDDGQMSTRRLFDDGTTQATPSARRNSLPMIARPILTAAANQKLSPSDGPPPSQEPSSNKPLPSPSRPPSSPSPPPPPLPGPFQRKPPAPLTEDRLSSGFLPTQVNTILSRIAFHLYESFLDLVVWHPFYYANVHPRLLEEMDQVWGTSFDYEEEDCLENADWAISAASRPAQQSESLEDSERPLRLFRELRHQRSGRVLQQWVCPVAYWICWYGTLFALGFAGITSSPAATDDQPMLQTRICLALGMTWLMYYADSRASVWDRVTRGREVMAEGFIQEEDWDERSSSDVETEADTTGAGDDEERSIAGAEATLKEARISNICEVARSILKSDHPILPLSLEAWILRFFRWAFYALVFGATLGMYHVLRSAGLNVPGASAVWVIPCFLTLAWMYLDVVQPFLEPRWSHFLSWLKNISILSGFGWIGVMCCVAVWPILPTYTHYDGVTWTEAPVTNTSGSGRIGGMFALTALLFGSSNMTAASSSRSANFCEALYEAEFGSYYSRLSTLTSDSGFTQEEMALLSNLTVSSSQTLLDANFELLQLALEGGEGSASAGALGVVMAMLGEPALPLAELNSSHTPIPSRHRLRKSLLTIVGLRFAMERGLAMQKASDKEFLPGMQAVALKKTLTVEKGCLVLALGVLERGSLIEIFAKGIV
ncbi:uncharacterized protein MYCFIDRAFT_180315 [Pseudocercospora fijiensis CIRAD86]|uniref:Uncharacterized protein n=1 Tax=Pseudocercospora fijiensis (strain CIRAD86) TaxID=383855 RepID=M2ZD80_PSEFD|nr:uncharacterized protein MYCFIDRAFT_180315 [Pseudocercospora fijiensis CIRAD86]EME77084.1 hypothetical protein MYCFIDRAFT_180315 [Pseudocercospora fijiensis CIRAD86]